MRVYSFEGAELRTLRPRPDVVHTIFRGYFGPSCVSPIMDVVAAALSECPTIVAFHDWQELRGYDSHARVRLTSWTFPRLPVIRSLDILLTVDSRVLTIGIAASNLVLSGRMRVHEERASFEHAFAAALAAR